MKYIDEFRVGTIARELAARIARAAGKPVTFMEVCGTHTMAIARCGLKALLPASVRLISGPGCPVCVTPQADIDRFIALGRLPKVILTTFGDMLRVPGSHSTLEQERARGTDVRVIYSPLDAVNIARENPDRRVVFCGVGFETTAPGVALAIQEAQKSELTNFNVYCAHKVVPPALVALASDPEIGLDGFLCPGHVSVIIGSRAYEPVARNFHLPCVIAGFEPLDILQAILLLVEQASAGRAEVETPYTRAVLPDGNPAALACMHTVFETADAEWRGLGVIPGSGLRICPEFAAYDAASWLPPLEEAPRETGCECGLILKGRQSPRDCPLFGTACTPANPVGPCMVSSEGACAAEYRYRRVETTDDADYTDYTYNGVQGKKI